MLIQSSCHQMLMESQVKFCCPQNMSGAWLQNRDAVFSSTAEIDGGMF